MSPHSNPASAADIERALLDEERLLTDAIDMRLAATTAALFLVVCLSHVTALRNILAFAAAVWAGMCLVRLRLVPPLALPMSVWFLVGTASAVWSATGVDTVKAAFYDIVFPAGAFYAAYLASQRRASYRLLAASVIGGSVLLAALSATTGVLAHYYPGEGKTSTLCIYALPFALILAGEHSYRARVLGYSGIACILLLGIATDNRMFWLSAAIVLASFWIWQWRYFTPLRRLLVVAALAVAAALAFAMVLRLTGAGHEPLSVLAKDNRPLAWQEWGKIAAQAPLLGYGLGLKNLKELGAANLPAEFVRDNPEMGFHAHSILLDIVLQTGLVGLLVYAWLLGSLAREAWRARATSHCIALSAALIGLIAGMLAKNFADDFMHYGPVIAFWGYAGVLVGRLRSASSFRDAQAI